MKNILSQSSWWVVNKALTRLIGLDASIILSDLITKQEYFNDKLDQNGFFFNTRDNIEEDTTVPIYRQNKALKILLDLGLIEISNKGVPPKTKLKINLSKIDDLITNIHISKKL